MLRYIDGDYGDPTTFQAIRKAQGRLAASALPRRPSLDVRDHRTAGKSGCAENARVIIEKPLAATSPRHESSTAFAQVF
jgi:glucose-6-phosphate 1-dehydrogenase